MDISNNINNIINNHSSLNSNIKNVGDRYSNIPKFSVANDSSIDSVNDKSSSELKRLKDVSQDFEAILLNQMFKSMRQTISKSNLVDGGMAENIFEDMLYDEYSKGFSKTKKMGISEMIFNQMKDYI